MLARLLQRVQLVNHCDREQQPNVVVRRQIEDLVQVDLGEPVGVLDVEAGVGDDEPLTSGPALYLGVEGVEGFFAPKRCQILCPLWESRATVRPPKVFT